MFKNTPEIKNNHGVTQGRSLYIVLYLALRLFYLFERKTALKMTKSPFDFILKSHFAFKIFLNFCRDFLHVEKQPD